jgi:hypothetical protein
MRHANYAWRGEGFNVAWGKFTSSPLSLFNSYDVVRGNISEKI